MQKSLTIKKPDDWHLHLRDGAMLEGVMLALNDEAVGRLTAQEYEGEITLGLPHDVVYPFIPQVLRRFNAAFPRMRVNLISSYTRDLVERFGRGECQMILTTEFECRPGGETLTELPLIWIGAIAGTAWRDRPLRLAFCRNCIFRSGAVRALDDMDIPWQMAVDSDNDRAVETTVSADLAVHAVLAGTEPPLTERISHGGALPELATYGINLYVAETARGTAETALVELLRDAYRSGGPSNLVSLPPAPRPSRSTAAS